MTLHAVLHDFIHSQHVNMSSDDYQGNKCYCPLNGHTPITNYLMRTDCRLRQQCNCSTIVPRQLLTSLILIWLLDVDSGYYFNEKQVTCYDHPIKSLGYVGSLIRPLGKVLYVSLSSPFDWVAKKS